MSRYAELLDTSVVAPRDRPEYWSAGIAKRFFPMRVDAVSAPIFDARLVGGQDRPSCGRLDPGAPAPGRAHERTDQCRRPRMHPALPPGPRRGAHRAGRSQLCAASWRPGLSRHLPTLRLRGPAGLRSAPLQRAALVHRGALREHRETQRNPGSWCRCAPRPVGSSLPGELGPRGNRRRRAAGQRRRGRGGDDPAACCARAFGEDEPFESRTPSSPLLDPPAAIRRRAPARPRSRPGAARERPLRVDALRAQALRGLRVRGVGVDPRSPPRGRDRRASRDRATADRRRRRAMGLPQPGELQSGVSREVRLRAERRPPRGACRRKAPRPDRRRTGRPVPGIRPAGSRPLASGCPRCRTFRAR